MTPEETKAHLAANKCRKWLANWLTTTVILAQLKDKEKKWNDIYVVVYSSLIREEYTSKLQTEEARCEIERQEDMT